MIKLELPFDIGDEIYLVREPSPYNRIPAKVYEIKIDRGGVSVGWVQYDYNYEDPDELWDEGDVDYEEFGKTWFLTWEEAVAKIKELYGVDYGSMGD